jgi:acid stress-induced BolA-like protein IbaG/YrbA
LTIVSDKFEQVPFIKRHRQVQKTLDEAGFGMDQVHAITIQSWTVEQYKKKQASS